MLRLLLQPFWRCQTRSGKKSLGQTAALKGRRSGSTPDKSLRPCRTPGYQCSTAACTRTRLCSVALRCQNGIPPTTAEVGALPPDRRQADAMPQRRTRHRELVHLLCRAEGAAAGFPRRRLCAEEPARTGRGGARLLPSRSPRGGSTDGHGCERVPGSGVWEVSLAISPTWNAVHSMRAAATALS
jgi:hypothetical protein